MQPKIKSKVFNTKGKTKLGSGNEVFKEEKFEHSMGLTFTSCVTSSCFFFNIFRIQLFIILLNAFWGNILNVYIVLQVQLIRNRWIKQKHLTHPIHENGTSDFSDAIVDQTRCIDKVILVHIFW